MYYRIWIINFVVIAFSIYRFLKTEEFFVWKKEQKNVMNILKLTLTIVFVLKSLNYSSLTEEIILTVNFNLKKWDVILFQINSEIWKNHFFRYESDLWIISKFKYNIIKRKCRELLKTLKKIRFWFYEMRFIIKINANILIAQFNCFAANFFETLIICWLVWIRLFNFDVKYVFEKKYIIINDLSRQFRESLNNINEVHEKNIDDFIDEQFNYVRVCFV